MDLEREIAESKIPLVIDFYADWCNPCRVMKPIIEKLERELQGKAKFVTIDVEENKELANKFTILSLPTFLIYKNGEKIKELVGIQRAETFTQYFKEN